MSAAPHRASQRETEVEKARGIHPRAAKFVDGLVSLFGIDGARDFLWQAMRYWKLEYGEDER